MFAKSKVTQSMIDAVQKVLGQQPVVEEKQEEVLNEAGAPIKEPTSTGMRVYGRSYGNSAKAKQDQTKSSVDDLKGPKEKEVKEELKGNQDKIDANKNDKIDAQDFEILRKKKVKEDMHFANKLLETVRKSDVPAYLRKAKGDTPLTVADVKEPKKDTISAPKNLAKARNEWKEEVELTEEEKELDIQINEVLSKDATAGDWIHDFVHSDNPKFAGKSKAERKKMALGAYYAKQNEEVEQVEEGAFKRMATDAEENEKEMERDGWKKVPTNIKDKSGAVHTPMSRARDLARAAFKKIQKEVK